MVKTQIVFFMLIKRNNLDTKDKACLHLGHIFQHPTSHPTTKSTQDAMVNVLKQNLLPLLGGKYGKPTLQST